MKSNFKKIVALTLSFALGLILVNQSLGQDDRQSQIQRIEQSIAHLQAELDAIKFSEPNSPFELSTPSGSDTRIGSDTKNQFPNQYPPLEPRFDSTQPAPGPIPDPVYPSTNDDWIDSECEEGDYLSTDPLLFDPILTESSAIRPLPESTRIEPYVAPSLNEPVIVDEPPTARLVPEQILPLESRQAVDRFIPDHIPSQQPALLPDRGGRFCPSSGRWLPPSGNYGRTASGYGSGPEWDYFDEHFYGQRRAVRDRVPPGFGR